MNFLVISLSRKRTLSPINYNQWILSTVLLFASLSLYSQKMERPLRLGVHIGYSQQDVFPFGDEDYAHTSRYIKLQIGTPIWERQRQSLEVLVEPSVYFVEHQLLNLFFIKPSHPNFQENRELFTQNRSYQEYALNLGLIYAYSLNQNFKTYGLISVGPMTATADTERQRKGFSFSDILGIGMRYELGKWNYDLRFSLRHVSSANLRRPNNGHNNAGIEIGFSYNL
ncbi:acyloxyacyl hydrolase [Nonlabens marinus]|uniref:Outer membrane protein beta-barrel domain-containing protein n=1 Tax=Nonlabens marinus S1-08 TaxID=1454201 RepID=W8VNX1_9FLAO|nr:acyloxyacyl hydrolase [Nonlabens marinus]BAO54135.1 hypothetical protein NMS_0126 [Nonlabens marinus S1-08]